MALSPEDVRNKLFTTVRLREGYEQAEVDEFLDEVEAELSRLLAENDDLRTKLADAGEVGDRVDRPAVAAPAPAVAEPKAQQIVVRSTDEVGAAAAKVLNMAQRTADEVVSEARDEADKLLDDARNNADRLTTDARIKADQVDRETRDRTSALEQQLDQQRQTTLGRLQAEKGRLEQEVESLRSFEREYRGRLRMFLEGQLQQLSDRSGDDTPLAPAGGPEPTATSTSEAGGAGHSGGRVADDTAAGAARGGGDRPDDSSGTPPASDGSGSADDGATSRRGDTRSALGRILEEEERNTDDRR